MPWGLAETPFINFIPFRLRSTHRLRLEACPEALEDSARAVNVNCYPPKSNLHATAVT